MSNNYYDNWERLVRAVLLREKLRQITLCPSIDSSCVTSASSSFRLISTSPINDSLLFSRNFQSSEDSEPSTGEMYNSKDQDNKLKSGSLSQSFFLDEKTGKVCYMVGARGLRILSAYSLTFGNGQHSKLVPDIKHFPWSCRILEIAELQKVRRLDIRCKIQSRILPRRNTYAAYLVYKLGATSKGLESVKAMIRFVNDESNEDAENRAHIVCLQTMEERNRPIVVRGKEVWKEVDIGNFYVGKEDDGEVEVRLVEKNMMVVKSGLIVGGIQFRPAILHTVRFNLFPSNVDQKLCVPEGMIYTISCNVGLLYAT